MYVSGCVFVCCTLNIVFFGGEKRGDVRNEGESSEKRWTSTIIVLLNDWRNCTSTAAAF